MASVDLEGAPVSYDQFDEDEPIPYSVTPEGHAALMEALLADVVAACRHDWHLAELGELYCVICGTVRSMRRQSIPSDLGPKREWKRP